MDYNKLSEGNRLIGEKIECNCIADVFKKGVLKNHLKEGFMIYLSKYFHLIERDVTDMENKFADFFAAVAIEKQKQFDEL